jgi:transposase
MEHYAGIDVSLELSSVCVVDAQGKIVRETKVASEPEALVAFFASLGFAVKRIGLEAGPLSAWLHAGLKRAGFDTVLLETRHVKAALSAMMVKTDRKDARGLAQLIRMGWFRPVHAKSMGSQEVRALLVARKQLLGRLIDVELSIRGILRGFGLKVGVVTRARAPHRISSRHSSRRRCRGKQRRPDGRWRQYRRAVGRYCEAGRDLPFRGCLPASEGAARSRR